MHVRSLSAIAVLTSAALTITSLPAAAAPADLAATSRAAYEAHRITLGVGMLDGRDLSQLDAFRASIGGTPVRLWTIWTNWGSKGFRDFPTAAAQGARDRGAVPFVWWEPLDPSDWSDDTYSRHLNIIRGDHDGYIRDYARAAKAFGTTVLLRFAHQGNADYLPWGWDFSSTDDNTIATFKAMWRHVHRIFEQEGADNVKWVWSIATQTCKGPCLKRPLGFPGVRYVDYMGFTWENWALAPAGSVRPSRPWRSMIKGFTRIVRRLQKVSRKPIVAAAIASAPDGGNKGRWIRKGYQQVYDRLRRVKIINYLNVDLSGPPNLHRDWSLHGWPLKAYAITAAKRHFRGRVR